VKAYKPITLQDTISRTKDLQDAVPKTKFLPKTNFPNRINDKKPFEKEWIGKNRMDSNIRDKLRKKKLCLSCQEPWAPRHKCSKGKAHYIEVFPDSEEDHDDIENEQEQDNEVHDIEEKGGNIASLSGIPRFHTFRMRGVIQGQRVIVLVDGGASHNFIDATLVS